MTIPPLKPGAFESVQAYVLRRLVDASEPMTSVQLAEGRPHYIAEDSPGVAASKLYALGHVVGRLKVGAKGPVRYAYYLYPDGLERLPRDFVWQGYPERSHSQPRPRRKLKIEPRRYAGDDGVTPTQEEPVSHTEPLAAAAASPHGVHALCSGEVAHTPYIPGVTGPTHVVGVAKAEPAPQPHGPRVVLDTAKGPKAFTIAEAKDLYRQLAQVFG